MSNSISNKDELYNSGESTFSYRGDFIGFQFGEETSASLRVVRVSDGSRYNNEILPNFNDKTIQVPGSDQVYYFGSDYSEKPFSMNIAFDNLTEKQFKKLSKVFGNKTPKRLVFDETPYKYYLVKVSDTPQLNYICFDEDNQRIYKGEGTINFVGYFPFARSVHKFLNEYVYDEDEFDPEKDGYFAHKTEWSSSIGLKDNNEEYYDILIDNTTFNLYNPGDLPAQWQIFIPFHNGVINSNNIMYSAFSPTQALISYNEITKKGNDDGIVIDSRLKCIRGYEELPGQKIITNTIYNEYLTKSQFFNIISNEENEFTHIDFESEISSESIIKYDYFYY